MHMHCTVQRQRGAEARRRGGAEAVTLGRRAARLLSGCALPVLREGRVLAAPRGRCDRFEMAQRYGGHDAARARECPLRASEKRARNVSQPSADGFARTKIIHDVRTRAGHGGPLACDAMQPSGYSRPGRPQRVGGVHGAQALAAAGLRPVAERRTLSPISLGTRRETPSHHFDDTTH